MMEANAKIFPRVTQYQNPEQNVDRVLLEWSELHARENPSILIRISHWPCLEFLIDLAATCINYRSKPCLEHLQGVRLCLIGPNEIDNRFNSVQSSAFMG